MRKIWKKKKKELIYDDLLEQPYMDWCVNCHQRRRCWTDTYGFPLCATCGLEEAIKGLKRAFRS